MKKQTLFKITTCAIMVALTVVLSFAKLWEMPLGGSVTLASMLPIILVSYFLGVRWGLVCGFTYSVLNFILDLGKLSSWGVTGSALVGSLIFDYLLAFTVLGFAGVFASFSKSRGGKANDFVCYIGGFVFAVFLRFVSHVISGVIFFASWMPEGWSNVWIYSIAYNGAFLLADLGICIVVGIIAFVPLKNAMKNLLRV